MVARRSLWGWLSIALIAMLVLGFTAACGSNDDDDEDAATTDTTTGATSEAVSTTASTDGDATEPSDEGDDSAGIEATASAAIDDAATMTGMDSEELGTIGACFQENTTADVVSDLRAGNTEMAEEVYRGCLENNLPPVALAMADPIIESASECGVTAAEGLSDSDVAAVESGDSAVIEQLTAETIDCLSAEYGDVLGTS
jgi:hypothetical protein